MLQSRWMHYGILIATSTLMTVPNLGSFKLWDIDEAINAEASREMFEANSYISPLFNFNLRTAKPALIYWLQILSCTIFGVNEFAARFPSFLAGLATLIVIYELARSMFNRGVALLSGLVLGSAIEFSLLAHAASPDGTLLFFTTLAFYFFWIGSRNGARWWYIPVGIAEGCACLTKGPIGILLPATTIITFLVWNKELRTLWNWRIVLSGLAIFMTAAPWYILVTLDTHGAWIKQFIGRENITRFLTPLENHRGPIYYHVIATLLFFSPWSIFLSGSIWYSIRDARKDIQQKPECNERSASRFLLVWIVVYLVFFSLAATKLPNYMAPIYPALAVLTARLLRKWCERDWDIPTFIWRAALLIYGFLGVIVGLGFIIAGGAITLPIREMHSFPGMEVWFWLGIVPIVGSVVAWWRLRKDDRYGVIFSITTASILLVGLMGTLPTVTFSRFHAPSALVEEAQLYQNNKDIRLISLFWFQPSLVYYSQREVEKLESWDRAADCLEMNTPVYMLVAEPLWKEIHQSDPRALPYRTIARQFDFQKKCEILVVTNR